MSEINYELNIEGILERLLEATKIKNLSKLGESLGLSTNALGQSKVRRSIALPVLLKCQKLAQQVGNAVSLDYLVYGEGDIKKTDDKDSKETEREDIYININARENFPSVKFEKGWLNRLMITKKVNDISSLYYYEIFDNIWIVNTSDKTVRKGIYAFGNPDMPVIRPCEQHISGKIIVSGETNHQTQEELEAIGIVGRIIWDGMSV